MFVFQRVSLFVKTLVLSALLSTAAGAEQRSDKGTFDVYIKGIRAGTLGFSGTSDGKSYAAAGKVQSGGIVGLLVKVRYDAQSRGRITSKGFVPISYSEKADTGKRVSEAVMEYKRGVPQVKKYNPPRVSTKGTLEPATQGGTLDPMTVIYAGLRDVPADELCKLNVQMFDGKRRSQVKLWGPRTSDGELSCSGEYRRLKGFTPKEMAERQSYPFRLVYAKEGDIYRVREMILTTDVGTARLVRR